MRKRKFLTIVVAILLLISTITVTLASWNTGGFLGITPDRWLELETNKNVLANPEQSPIKYETGQPIFSSLPLDTILGANRELVRYNGEAPATKEGDVPEWADKSPRAAGSLASNDSNWDDENATVSQFYVDTSTTKNVSIAEYWGKDTDIIGSASDAKKAEMAVGAAENSSNKREITSLRLYNLYTSPNNSGFGFNLKNSLFTGIKKLTGLISKLLDALISAKNINISQLLEQLGLQDLLDTFNTILIGEGGNLSIFMVFAIVSMILVIVAWAVNFIKGRGFSIGNFIANTVVIGLVGVMLISMAQSKSIVSTATLLANKTEEIISEVTTDQSDDSSDAVWKVEASYNSLDSQVTYLREKALMSRPVVELQINMQFGVDSIEELNINEFGEDVDSSYFSNIAGYGRNIGYWFWWANSPAPEGTFPGNRSSWSSTKYRTDQEAQMDKMLVSFQKIYDSTDDQKIKNKILTIMQSFARPEPGKATVIFLLLAVEYVLIAFCFWEIVLRIILGKLLVAGSVLTLPISGILILSSRKKLIDTGKAVLLVFVTYSLQIFVLSLVFDLFLHILGKLIEPTVKSMLVAIALTVALKMFMPKLIGYLDKLFMAIDKSMDKSGTLRQAKSKAKMAMRRDWNKVTNAIDNSHVTKYDENGNAYQVSRKGGLLSKMAHGIGNTMASAESRDTYGKIAREAKKARIDDRKKATSEAINRNASDMSEVENNIDATKQQADDAVFNGGEKTYDNINYSTLNKQQKEKYDNIAKDLAELEKLKQRKQELENAIDKGNASPQIKKEYEELKNNVNNLDNKVENQKKDLLTNIEENNKKISFDMHKKDLEKILDERDKLNETKYKNAKRGSLDAEQAVEERALIAKQKRELAAGKEPSTSLTDEERLEAFKNDPKINAAQVNAIKRRIADKEKETEKMTEQMSSQDSTSHNSSSQNNSSKSNASISKPKETQPEGNKPKVDKKDEGFSLDGFIDKQARVARRDAFKKEVVKRKKELEIEKGELTQEDINEINKAARQKSEKVYAAAKQQYESTYSAFTTKNGKLEVTTGATAKDVNKGVKALVKAGANISEEDIERVSVINEGTDKATATMATKEKEGLQREIRKRKEQKEDKAIKFTQKGE